MRITFITASLNSGGSERVMSLLANDFSRKGNRVEIICVNKPIIFYSIEDSIKVWLLQKEISGNQIMKKVIWLRKHIKEDKPDVVIAFMTSVYCMTLVSLLGINVPVITSERIDPNHSDLFRKILRILILPLTTHHVVQTEQIKSYYPKFIQKKTSIIFNPVNEEVFSIPQTSLKGRSEEKMNRIISVGRLTEQKNQQMMITAFAKVANEFPDWQLVIYGEGSLRAELESLVSSFKLQDRVFLPGRTERVIEELRKSRIFCLSSDYEGMSNAMIEAICVGLPIVTTEVSGVIELIEQGSTGFVVPREDEDAMVNRLKMLMSDEKLMELMSLNNMKKASLFKLDNIVNQWESLINNVVMEYNGV